MSSILIYNTFQYWFEWRHKCRKKAADTRRYDTEAYKGRNRFIPLNDLEVRVIELCGKASNESTSGPSVSHMENDEEYLHDGLTSDSVEPLDVKELNTATTKPERSSIWESINNTTGNLLNCHVFWKKVLNMLQKKL